MLNIIARNWVPLLFVAAMAYLHIGMHRGQGHSGHGGAPAMFTPGTVVDTRVVASVEL